MQDYFRHFLEIFSDYFRPISGHFLGPDFRDLNILATGFRFMELIIIYQDLFRDILAKRYVYHYFSEAFRSNSRDRLSFRKCRTNSGYF